MDRLQHEGDHMSHGLRSRYRAGLSLLVAVGALALTASGASAIVAGAGFTTFDVNQGGCLDNHTGINCNNYTSKDDVYQTGGPTAAGLSDGSYYFAVLVPGFQNGGYQDGADGNLSDTTAGLTTGDLGSGDTIADRTFTVVDHAISTFAGTDIGSYRGSFGDHLKGTSTAQVGSTDIVQLMPYDDTSNGGGVYILAICQLDQNNQPPANPSGCKFDAFRVPPGVVATPFASLSGEKYYDANANGQLDAGEVGIPGWQISLTDSVNETLTTDSGGLFSRSDLAPDTYNLVEQQATNHTCTSEVIGGVATLVCSPTWLQSGNTVDQSVAPAGSSVTLNADKSYTVQLGDTGEVSRLLFGNVCLGRGGGLTLGFWSNKNGQRIMKAGDNFASALAFLSALNLRNGAGANFDPTSYSQFRTWLLGAKATNMAYMLSAQLAAMELNVRYGLVGSGALIYAPGATSANSGGFATVGAVMAEADAELLAQGLTKSGSPYRAHQEALKTALDRANNNLNFVESGPASCPAPQFG
jgi:hypothetical protein